MKNRSFVILYWFVTLITNCYCFFDDIGMGARQTAIGNAFTAVCDDVYSIYYNPAGLGQMNNSNIAMMYAQLWPSISGEGLNDMFVGVNTLLRNNTGVGFSWQTRKLEGVVSADTVSVSAGRKVKDNLLIGVTGKYLKFELTGDEVNTIPELRNNNSKSAFSLDLGVLLRVKDINIGMSIKNVNTPDIGLFEPVPVPMVLKAGVSKKLTDKVLLAMDISNIYSVTEFSIGSEIMVRENIIIRAGMLGSNAEYSKICLGAGLKINKLQLDYSYVVQILGGVGNDTGTHRVSLNFKLK